MDMLSDFYHEKEGDTIWCVDEYDVSEEGTIDLRKGPFLFSFDKKHIYNYWCDYPNNMSQDEIQMFDKEFPQWAIGGFSQDIECHNPKSNASLELVRYLGK